MSGSSRTGHGTVLDDLDGAPMPGRCHVRAWRPAVAGISEVFHADLVDFGYPMHTHDTWTVLIVDSGAIEYDLDTRACGVAGADYVAVLPPGVLHDGRPATNVTGFRKRNLYLDAAFLPSEFIGPAVDRTVVRDGALRAAIAELHDVLGSEPDRLDAEARLALIGRRLARHLRPAAVSAPRAPEPAVALRLRQLLDDTSASGLTLAEAARRLERSVPHLVRSFSHAFGVSPHAYLTGRRVEAARKLLLAGEPAALVASRVGFYDQAHLTRHFRRHTATTPAAYARGRP